MEGRLAVPFHFAVEFLVLVVAIGAAVDALRARRHGAGAWSLGQALGFLLLGAAEAIHGSLVARADAGIVILGLRAASFALLAIWARPGASLSMPVAASTAPALFFPGPDRMLAAVPALGALVVAARAAKQHRSDQDPATFAFAAAFISFAAAEVATAMSPAGGGTPIAIAHAARALGALFLARWLWSSVVRSVRVRVVAALVAVLTITVLIVGGTVNLVMADRIEGDQLQRLADLGSARVQAIYGLGENANKSAKLFAGTVTVGDRLAEPDSPASRARLETELRALATLFELDFVMALDARGVPRASVEQVGASGLRTARMPELRAIAVAGLPVVKQAPTHGVQVLPVREGGVLRTQVVAVGSHPVRRGGRALGVVAVGYRVDQAYLTRVKADTGGADATLVVATDSPVTTTIGQTAAAQEAVREVEGIIRVTREEARRTTASLPVADERFATAFVPIAKQRGTRQVVAVLALSLRGDVLSEAQLGVTRTLFLLTLLAMMVAAVLAWASGGRVTRPLRALTEAARELQAGNLEARARVGSADEVGALGNAFNEMAAELQRKTGDLERAAEAEATLRARLEAVLQSMSDGLLATDLDGTVVTFNRAAEEIFGREAQKVMGRPLGEVMKGAGDGGRPLVAIALGGRAAEGQLQTARGIIPVALTAAPLQDATGNGIGRVIVVRDVSSEYQAERMKSEFLANVSHELRTPITPIKGYAEILARKKFPREKMMAFLESILESVSRLERIADILIDFAALEAGRLKPKHETVPVRELIDTITQRWRERDDDHRFIRRGGEDVPPVLGDQRLLMRAFDELMDNAVKFSPEGGPIEVIAEPVLNGSSPRPAKVKITVRDKGIGIEPARMPDLFQDFRQLDGSETRAFGGLGLGLAYVKRIATVHGGDVSVESSPGKGSAFSLVLPAADARIGRVSGAPSQRGRAPAGTKKRAPRRAARGRAR